MAQPSAPYSSSDFSHSPLVVFYEMTRACNLKCVHCRADAQRRRHPDELSTNLARQLIQQLTDFPLPPLLVLTGGDPFKRPDLFELIQWARSLGLTTALSPSATPLVTDAAIQSLTQAGLHRLAMSLDGVDPATHDGFRRVPGSFDRTLRIIKKARSENLPVQVNTTVSIHNVEQIDAIGDLLETLDIELWSIFFLIPTGRGLAQQRISPPQYETVFEKIWKHSRSRSFAIKTTEAPHYRRYVSMKSDGLPMQAGRFVGTNDGKGVMFFSHVGEIFPSGFLPSHCGTFPHDSVVDAYQNHPTFKALRNPDRLGGKCGRCEFREICGGSRARAFALTGDLMAAEPDCVYLPSN
jgi:radical SAM protein with 4Fe4S-binding SPASM domain